MNRYEDAVKMLAQELSTARAPAATGKAVLAEFDRVHRIRRRRQWIAGSLVAAASVAAVWLGLAFSPTGPAPGPAAPPAAPAASEQPFVAIPYVLPPAPYERVEVVRMRLPVAALIAAGLPVQTSDPGAQADADVLLGQDGRPRAVRLVSISSFN